MHESLHSFLLAVSSQTAPFDSAWLESRHKSRQFAAESDMQLEY